MKRISPWVLRWWGPILSRNCSSSPFREVGARIRDLVLLRIFTGVRRHFRGPARMSLAEWVPLPVMGHDDAAQVGMALEANAEHVEDFSFVPVG